MNVGLKSICAFLLVVVVAAAGVGLLVQHRKLREQRQALERLENVNQQLVASREERASANKELADELYKLRDTERARVAAVRKERAAWTRDRAAFSNRVVAASADVKKARAAQGRAEKSVTELRAQVKDLTAANKKLRAERENFRAACGRLEEKLAETKKPAPAPEAKQPVPAPKAEVPPPAPPSETPPIPLSAPSPSTRKPEEREAHEKEELNDLLNIK